MSWNKSTVTDSGVVLLNESLAGHTLTITSAVGGAGTLDDEALKAATDVVDKKQTFNLLGIEDFEQGKRIGIQITNKGILESYILHQIGVRARLEYQEEESLLFILQDDRGIEVPAEVDNPGFLFEVYAVMFLTMPILPLVQLLVLSPLLNMLSKRFPPKSLNTMPIRTLIRIFGRRSKLSKRWQRRPGKVLGTLSLMIR